MKSRSDKQPALKDVFKNDFRIGAALSVEQILGREPATSAIVAKHFNTITPENILKWEEVHPEPDRYNFEPADQYVAFGEKHKMFIIGHTLVWFYQTPAWVFQDKSGKPLRRDALLGRMRDHIFTVMGRYKGRIHGWDVVNEAVTAEGQLRKNKWLEIIGEDYMQKAYEFAREADPDAELYYNDYDEDQPAKCAGVVRLVRGLQAQGIRIDGVGIQGHWFLDRPSLREIEEQFVTLGTLGVKLMITELDIGVLPFYPVDAPAVALSSFDPATQKKYNPYPEALPDAVQQAQAERYAELFSLFRKHRDKINRVTFWGVHDAQSWRSYLPIRGRADYPLLFDRQFKAKPALPVIVRTAEGGK